MTDEELQKAIQEVSDSLDNLPEEEKKGRGALLSKKATLDGIKKAKEKGDKSEEIYYTACYGVLTSWGEKHPFLARLLMSNFRWSGF